MRFVANPGARAAERLFYRSTCGISSIMMKYLHDFISALRCENDYAVFFVFERPERAVMSRMNDNALSEAVLFVFARRNSRRKNAVLCKNSALFMIELYKLVKCAQKCRK